MLFFPPSSIHCPLWWFRLWKLTQRFGCLCVNGLFGVTEKGRGAQLYAGTHAAASRGELTQPAAGGASTEHTGEAFRILGVYCGGSADDGHADIYLDGGGASPASLLFGISQVMKRTERAKASW